MLLIEAFACVIIWLGLGGFAYRAAFDDVGPADAGGLLLVCVLFAPFAVGAIAAERYWLKPTAKGGIE